MRLLPLERSPEQARGVGQFAARVERFMPRRPADCDGVGLVCRFSLALALGVGHAEHEQALAAVWCADFLRREESFRNPVTQAFQLASDLAISEVEVVWDVLQENKSGATFGDDAGDMGPEVTGVVGAAPLAGNRERLARIARKQEVHRATPRAPVEAGKVVPDRSRIQGLVFHPGHEDARGEGVPLDMTHSPVSWLGEDKPKVESSGAGTERQPEQASPRSVSRIWGGM